MSEKYVDLHYYSIGSGFPFVLNHGWTGDGLTYLFQVPLAYKYRLIFPDLRGHGRSPKPKEGSFELMAGDLKKLLDTLGIKKAIICGASMGGMVSLQFVLDYPENVEALILSDTMPGTTDNAREFLEKTMLLLQDKGVELLRQMYAEQFLRPESSRTPHMDVWVKSRIERTSGLDIESLIGITRSQYNFDVTERLAEIKVPTLIVEAKGDEYIQAASVQMHERIAGSKLVGIDCGHGSPTHKPDLWNQLVSDWLKEIGH